MIIFSIILAFFIPIVFEWIQSGTLEITSAGIRDALFFGIMVPVLILISKNIKNDYLFVILALVIIFAVLVFTRFAFHF
ncbi:hypothetical protein SAMN05444280_11711 [Tangfeifania diversioriginum]|uniref:Uncharacterized protein n=1 Tax=Tangfeifania diversioriginum TaxID=1168035 RepID=A0A1M6IJK3_9BACT|nr:hypothetical protein SAMN05444280_11711 [Tangfeifania diversioriginum]